MISRLLLVLTSPVRGGVEEVVLGLLKRLDRSEFALGLAAPPPLIEAFAHDLAGVPVDIFPVAAESWRERGEVARLGAALRAFRPDIVNSHLFRATLVAAPLARWHSVPHVVETYHGREGWRTGLVNGRFVVDRLVSHALDRVIAVSEAARDFLVRVKGYPRRKVVVIPNGRDLTVFQPGRDREGVRKQLGLDAHTPLVGVIGRLEAQKGHVHLLEAWQRVVREFPDARLLVVGEGSLRSALEQQAREARIAASVIFAGFRADVPRLLDAIDVLALPSLYEGMPLTAIEASAMARPVVATAVDGTPEVIRDGVTGVLVPAADSTALGRALVSLLGDPAHARRLGAAGRAWAFDRFDLGRHVAATAALYRSLVAR